jgi:predicted DNA-binding transcriptional regulator YafY
MASGSHDTLVKRLAMMLVKLNQGESLDPRALAQEFGVNVRTIQRDINERFGYLPLEKIEGTYRMTPAFLGRLSIKDIERFAALAGVSGLFPSLTVEFLRDIFDARVEQALLVKGHNYEDLRGKEQAFKDIERAIVGCRRVRFVYPGNGGSKTYEVDPHKLVNFKGVWYLAARHDGRLKTFSFSKLDLPAVTDTVFEPDPKLLDQLQTDDGIWTSDKPIEVVLTVDAQAAPYFRRRKLIANQVIDKELADGGLIVSAKVGHANQVLPIVRYWIPHLRVIAPEEMATRLEQNLLDFIKAFRPGVLNDNRFNSDTSDEHD